MKSEKIIIHKAKSDFLTRMIIAFATFGFGTNLILFYFNHNFKNGQNEMSSDFFKYLVPVLFGTSLIFFTREFFGRRILISISNNQVEIMTLFKNVNFDFNSVEKIMFNKDGVLIQTDSDWKEVLRAYRKNTASIFDVFFNPFAINVVFALKSKKPIILRNISIKNIPKLKKLQELFSENN